MKELETIIEDLKNHFSTKAVSLRNDIDSNAYTEGLLLNRQRDIESFEIACMNYDRNPLLKNEILENFKNAASKIKADIDLIEKKNN